MIKEIEFTTVKTTTAKETLTTEEENGLQYAVLFQNTKVIALFGSQYWAEKFVQSADPSMGFTIRKISQEVRL